MAEPSELKSDEAVSRRDDERGAAAEQFASLCGLPPEPPAPVQNEAHRLANLSPAELRSMDAGQCAEGAYLLSRLASWLQECVNRRQSALSWAEESLNQMTAGRGDGASREERRASAVTMNERAGAMNRLRVTHRCMLERIAHLPQKYDQLSQTLRELARIKHGKEKRVAAGDD